MIETLLLMRHAKSSWSDMSMTDHERPLNKRGKKSADTVARILTLRGYAPDQIWTSDAKRTKQTAKRLIRLIPGAQTVHFVPDFYHASLEDVLSVCRRETQKNDMDKSTVKALMLLGHNPGWTALYHYFCADHGALLSNLPTGACAVFKRFGRNEHETSPWYSPTLWRPIDLLLPRDLMPENEPLSDVGSDL